ncbi:MAG TPA: M90 family metallopeptidase [Azospira sp.]|nr:M90 family metallopeptidase [Azospira sp.]
MGWLDKLLGRRRPRPIPEALWHSTLAGLPFLQRLGGEELARLKALSEAFLAEKQFSGAGGLEVTDAMGVNIAVQGCLPILNLGLEWYRGWVEVVVYPAEFVVPRQEMDPDGVVHEYAEVASGQAWEGGPLIVSWQDTQMAGAGYNVVIHEFAHKLDMLNGEPDGLPPLPRGMDRQAWLQDFDAAYEDFCRRVERAERQGEAALEALPIDPYGAEHPGEFFAVFSETFFEQPEVAAATYPALYAQLAAFYRQDPLAGT